MPKSEYQGASDRCSCDSKFTSNITEYSHGPTQGLAENLVAWSAEPNGLDIQYDTGDLTYDTNMSEQIFPVKAGTSRVTVRINKCTSDMLGNVH